MNNSIELNIQKIVGNKAILVFGDDSAISIEWPISKLPRDIQEGKSIKVKVYTDDEIELDHQIIARKLLEEMIN